ncbi:MAG: pectate lyase [Bacteroidales bacterium]|jgi:pectate lyase|nr:pectate lyase [Bacteroidales bacterium]
MKKILSTILAMSALAQADAAINIQQVGGWFESGYVTWSPVEGASSYTVYCKSADAATYTQLDAQLVRQYPTYLRADAVGLKAGDYQFKIVANTGDEAESATFTATAHDRSGFAHVDMPDGIGAYKNDGTLKDGAKILYVYADNAKTITTDVITSSKGTTTTGTGLQDIVTLYQKGYDKTPLAIRIIGTIKAENMDRFDSSAEGLQIKGKNSYNDMPITLEGIGCDAALHGFGLLLRNCKGVELRNFAIMWCIDDAISLDTDNSHVWVHNLDLFYGMPGGDSDQVKGDGTVDIKDESTHITVSYNHFIDCGKSSLGGMKSETTSCWHTYHHNWFDHSDSRHPRIRTMFFHIYNNYYDGNSKYGVGMTTGGSALVEQNYFRNCKYPMLTSKQGSDAEGDGTFSGENGGIIKAFNNIVINPRKLQYYSASAATNGTWDAYLATTRDEVISSDVKAYAGGSTYNNEADKAARTTYIENKMDSAADVPAIVRGELGAGRMQHGDFSWSFRNSAQDENYSVISDLTSAVNTYQSTLIGFADGTAISNGGATVAYVGGDGIGVTLADNESYVPSWAGNTGGGTTTPEVESTLAIGTDDDYFWFNADNEDLVNAFFSDGTFLGGTFQPTFQPAKGDGTICSDYVGSIRIASGGTFTVHYASGITSVQFYVSGNGSQSWSLASSLDGQTYTSCGSFTGSTGGHPSVNASFTEPMAYVRLTNSASGNRDVQGMRLFTPADPASLDEIEEIDQLASSADEIYDLLGRRRTLAPNGQVYVHGGKKICF